MSFSLFGQEIDLLAAWGAVAGTFALLLLWRQHLRDRAHLVLEAELKPVSEKDASEPKLVFSLSATNLGRRPIVLEEAGIKVPNTDNADPRLREQVSELRLQLPPKGLTLTEGQKQKIVMNPFTFSLKERKAAAFVRDTKGIEYIAEFPVPRPEAAKGESKKPLAQASAQKPAPESDIKKASAQAPAKKPASETEIKKASAQKPAPESDIKNASPPKPERDATSGDKPENPEKPEK